MGATADKYSRMVKMLKLSDGSKGVLHKYALQLAAYLDGYTTTGLTEAQKSGIVAHRLFLDDLLTNTDGDGNTVFVGRVKKDSFNYTHHIAARRGKKWHKDGAGNLYNLLNDAGLNTLPDAQMGTTVKARYANYMKVLNNYIQSAFYSNTTSVKVAAYKVVGDTATKQWEETVRSSLDAKAEVTEDWVIRHLSEDFAEGDTVRLVVSVTNEEGTYISPYTVQFTSLGTVEFMQVYKVTSISQKESGTPYIVAITSADYSRSTGLYALFESAQLSSFDSEVPSHYNVQIHGAPGTSITDNVFEDYLPKGKYYGWPAEFQGGDRTKIVAVDDNSRPYGWIESQGSGSGSGSGSGGEHSATGFSVVSINAQFSLSGSTVILTDLSVTVRNSGTSAANISISAAPKDALIATTIGTSTAQLVAAGEEAVITILDPDKDDPVRWTGATEPTVIVLQLTSGQNTEAIERDMAM